MSAKKFRSWLWTVMVLASQQTLLSQTSNPIELDLTNDLKRQVIVDRQPGQYLGHPSTCLLEDGKTLLLVYPKGHGRGEIVYKRSSDGGRTWSERLPTPENWKTSQEVPTLFRVEDANHVKRLILFSGLHPAKMAVSEDDGRSWSPLQPIGDWGGIVVMASVVPLKTGLGHYLAMFHDDGRYLTQQNQQKSPIEFTLLQTRTDDGGRTWSRPEAILRDSEMHLCEPGVVRSPDGGMLVCLLRENSRRYPSQAIFSNDEARTWSSPKPLPESLTGDRHVAKYASDGRLVISFRKVCAKNTQSNFDGDWVVWVGTFADLVEGNGGQYLVRLKDNHHRWDCAYPGVELLPDGTFILTTYGHWTAGEEPYIIAVHLRLDELDQIAEQR